MRRLKRKKTLCFILVIFLSLILLHIYLTCRLVSNWKELPTGVYFVLRSLPILSNLYKMQDMAERKNATVNNEAVVIFSQQQSRHDNEDLRFHSSEGKGGPTANVPVIIYWTTVFGKKATAGDKYTWPYFYIGDSCPVNCTLTTDHSMINEAVAIIIHARNIKEMPTKDLKRQANIHWILHSNESPKFTPALNSKKIMSKFNFYLSYRLDADFSLSLFRKPLLHPSPMPFHKKRKTALAVALYSHCEAVRTQYLIQLMKEIEVDSYGSCLHNTDLPMNIRPRDQRFSNFSMDLIDLYRTYKFTIVFMNSDCDYFVDEKLFYALSAGSVPVFMGTSKVCEFLPGNLGESIIEVRNFKTPKLLATHLKQLGNNEKAYNNFLKWKYKGFQFPESYSSSTIGKLWDSSLPVFCRICQRLKLGEPGRNGLPIETCEESSISD